MSRNRTEPTAPVRRRSSVESALAEHRRTPEPGRAGGVGGCLPLARPARHVLPGPYVPQPTSRTSCRRCSTSCGGCTTASTPTSRCAAGCSASPASGPSTTCASVGTSSSRSTRCARSPATTAVRSPSGWSGPTRCAERWTAARTAARGHRAGLLRGLHPDRDRRGTRHPARHRQDPHLARPAEARRPAGEHDGGDTDEQPHLRGPPSPADRRGGPGRRRSAPPQHLRTCPDCQQELVSAVVAHASLTSAHRFAPRGRRPAGGRRPRRDPPAGGHASPPRRRRRPDAAPETACSRRPRRRPRSPRDKRGRPQASPARRRRRCRGRRRRWRR